MPQGAAFQHAELVEQEVRVAAIAVVMPVQCSPALIAVGRADPAVHVLRDEIQPVAIMNPVDRLYVHSAAKACSRPCTQATGRLRDRLVIIRAEDHGWAVAPVTRLEATRFRRNAAKQVETNNGQRVDIWGDIKTKSPKLF